MEKVSTTLLGRFWLDPTVSSFVASLRYGDVMSSCIEFGRTLLSNHFEQNNTLGKSPF